jgi:CHAT domain-containing protein
LSYWLAPQRSFLWVLTARGRRLFILPPAKEIESQVEAYLKSIQDLRDPLETPQPAAEHLYQTLLAPARELIPQGAQVVVVPDGALHNLNFETLPVPGKSLHYWIEDAVVSVAPSLAVQPDADVPVALKSILIVGNPESSGAEYPKLPNAADEMRSVESRMSALQQTVFEGAHAEPAAYGTSRPEQFSVIHFTTHAAANSSSPLESAIILSPVNDAFKLYARDVAQVPLTAELVTISACRGAGARVYSGEGLVGFTWAFLQAGAHHVIAGLWDVSDSSTAQLMDSLYENLSQSRSPTGALREAKLKMIHSQSNFRKPYYWAPFQVYVGSGVR